MEKLFNHEIDDMKSQINRDFDTCEQSIMSITEEERKTFRELPSQTFVNMVEFVIQKKNDDIVKSLHKILRDSTVKFMSTYRTDLDNKIAYLPSVYVPDDYFQSIEDTLSVFYEEFKQLKYEVNTDLLVWEKCKPKQTHMILCCDVGQQFGSYYRQLEKVMNLILCEIGVENGASVMVKYHVIINFLMNYAVDLLSLLYV